jgi:signal recognition particle subunit SRP54
MTPGERAEPALINGSRRKRIANGSGTKVQHVKQLVKQFEQMRVLMKQMATGTPPTPQQISRMQGGAPRPKYKRR